MTYRYIFLLLHTTNAAFLARRSRSLGTLSAGENRRWLARTLATTLAKTQHLGEEVYLAMLSRGYQGEIYSLEQLRFGSRDSHLVGADYRGRVCAAMDNLPLTGPVFEARELSYRYAGRIPALDGVSLSVRAGEMVALAGANGSGKSTLLKLLDGLIFPTAG